ncbi:MAG: hypothetical protein QM639_09085 [Rhodocyclaceae bacterium]
MKTPKTPGKPRNHVHLAMMQSRHGGAHDKSHKRQRANDKAAWMKSLRQGGRDEGGFSHAALA